MSDREVITKDWCQRMGYPNNEEDAKDLFSKVIQVGKSPDCPIFSLYPSVITVLDKLKSKGYQLAMIANWDVTLMGVLEHHKIDKYFEVIILSGEIGIDKPDPEIFKRALHKLNVNAKDVIYRGDDLKKDMQGALGSGILPIWANYSNKIYSFRII